MCVQIRFQPCVFTDGEMPCAQTGMIGIWHSSHHPTKFWTVYGFFVRLSGNMLLMPIVYDFEQSSMCVQIRFQPCVFTDGEMPCAQTGMIGIWHNSHHPTKFWTVY